MPKETLAHWLTDALTQWEVDVQDGCTCARPSVSGGMKFRPRAESCPLHGEGAVS